MRFFQILNVCDSEIHRVQFHVNISNGIEMAVLEKGQIFTAGKRCQFSAFLTMLDFQKLQYPNVFNGKIMPKPIYFICYLLVVCVTTGLVKKWPMKSRTIVVLTSLFVFSIDDPKQNAGSLLTPVSSTVFDALTHGTLGFAFHGSFNNHLFQ